MMASGAGVPSEASTSILTSVLVVSNLNNKGNNTDDGLRSRGTIGDIYFHVNFRLGLLQSE